jgi:hypothetical protein
VCHISGVSQFQNQPGGSRAPKASSLTVGQIMIKSLFGMMMWWVCPDLDRIQWCIGLLGRITQAVQEEQSAAGVYLLRISQRQCHRFINIISKAMVALQHVQALLGTLHWICWGCHKLGTIPSMDTAGSP